MMETMQILWPAIRAVLVFGLAAAAIGVTTWHLSRPKSAAQQNEAHAKRCASCAARVYHQQHDGERN